MIFDLPSRPKGITLVRLTKAGQRPTLPLNISDLFPLWPLGTSDAAQWRPDVTTSQGWAFSTSANTSPLASGALATNHTRREPVKLTFECLVTDSPLLPTSLGLLPGGTRRSDSIIAGLIELCQSRAFVAVLSPLYIIETAVITQVSLPRDPNDGNSYRGVVSLEERRTYGLQVLGSAEDAVARLGAQGARSGGVVVG
jgi:hypothetical protein